jgi:hypothetical protein
VHQVGFYYVEVFNHIESVPTNFVEIIPFVLEITRMATARNFKIVSKILNVFVILSNVTCVQKSSPTLTVTLIVLSFLLDCPCRLAHLNAEVISFSKSFALYLGFFR